MDLDQRRALGTDRGDVLTGLREWLAEALGHSPRDMTLFERALTHGSLARDNYERLEFLGDRVLGLVMAEWQFELFPGEPEGKLSSRVNALVAGEMCARVARKIGVVEHLRLGKQARDDGGATSGNILGDVVEALTGALFLEGGLDAARGFVRRGWAELVELQPFAPKHPKSALQEWAAAHNRAAPVYAIADRSGPHHAPRFTVTVSIGAVLIASACGASKQEAETEAAKALLEQLGP